MHKTYVHIHALCVRAHTHVFQPKAVKMASHPPFIVIIHAPTLGAAKISASHKQPGI